MKNLNEEIEKIIETDDHYKRLIEIQKVIKEDIEENPKNVLELIEDRVQLNSKYKTFVNKCLIDLNYNDKRSIQYQILNNYRDKNKYEKYKELLINEKSFINIIKDIRQWKHVSCPYNTNATIKNNLNKEVVAYWKNIFMKTGIFIIKIKTKYIAVKLISNLDKDSYIATKLTNAIRLINGLQKEFGGAYVNREHSEAIEEQIKKEKMKENLKKLQGD